MASANYLQFNGEVQSCPRKYVILPKCNQIHTKDTHENKQSHISDFPTHTNVTFDTVHSSSNKVEAKKNMTPSFLLLLAGTWLVGHSSLGMISSVRAETIIAIRASEPSPLMNATSDDPAEWSGLEWDMIQSLCDADAGYLSNCSYLKTNTLDERIDVVVNGSADVSISGIAVTDDRCERAQCVRPFYFDYSGYLYTTPEKVGDIESYESIKGANICEMLDSSYVGPLEDLGFNIVDIPARSDALEMIQAGECLALAGDSVFAFPQEGLVRVDLPAFVNQPASAVVANNASQELVSSLSAGLTSFFQEGSQSSILEFEKTNFVDPGLQGPDENVALQVAAISAFNTGVGREGATGLPKSFGTNFAGIANDQVFNVTLAVWEGNLPPLFEGQANGTVGSIGGIEGYILNQLCSRPSINCADNVIGVSNLDNRFQIVENGTADISIGAIVISDERLARVPFVTPFYYSGGMGLFTTESKKSVYDSESSSDFLNGISVCSEVDSIWTNFLEGTGVVVKDVPNAQAAVQEIESGECELFAFDSVYAIPNLVQIPYVVESTIAPYGIALSPDASPALYSEISAFMISQLDDGSESGLLQAAQEEASAIGARVDPKLENVTSIITSLEEVNDVNGSQDNTSNPNSGSVHVSVVKAAFLGAILMTF
jgi:ABC-type amino acid transport substrate-binding protein